MILPGLDLPPAFALAALGGCGVIAALVVIDTLRARRLVVVRTSPPASPAGAQPPETELMDIVQEAQALTGRVAELIGKADTVIADRVKADTVIADRVKAGVAAAEADIQARIDAAVAEATANYQALITGLNGQIADLEAKFAELAGAAPAGEPTPAEAPAEDPASHAADPAPTGDAPA